MQNSITIECMYHTCQSELILLTLLIKRSKIFNHVFAHFACDPLNPVISDNESIIYANVQKLGSRKVGLAFMEEWRVQICNLFTCLQGRIILFFFFQLRALCWYKSDFYVAFPSLLDTLAYRPDYWKESLWSLNINMESYGWIIW